MRINRKVLFIFFVIILYSSIYSNELEVENLRKKLDENVIKLRNYIEAYWIQFWSSVPIPDYIDKSHIKNNITESGWDLYFTNYLDNYNCFEKFFEWYENREELWNRFTKDTIVDPFDPYKNIGYISSVDPYFNDFVLVSSGPDHKRDINFELNYKDFYTSTPLFSQIRIPNDLIYDPTNGLLSNGDIIYPKKYFDDVIYGKKR